MIPNSSTFRQNAATNFCISVEGVAPARTRLAPVASAMGAHPAMPVRTNGGKSPYCVSRS
eukprot:836630-Lingulodinium_polyedra.AAC.1